MEEKKCFNCGCKIGGFGDYFVNIEGLIFCSEGCRKEYNKKKLLKGGLT